MEMELQNGQQYPILGFDVGKSREPQEDEIMKYTRLVGPTTIGLFGCIEHVYLFREIF